MAAQPRRWRLRPAVLAIDAGVAAGATFDQRGLARTFDDPGVANATGGDGTDIGAFEGQGPSCTLTCPSNITVSNDAGQCGAAVIYPDPSAIGCGTITSDHASGDFFAVGTTTVTLTSSVGPSCSFTITVNDTEDPTITAPDGATVGTDSDSCVATGVSLGSATTADNCTVSSVTNNAPATFPLGSTTVTWTVTDNHGNTDTDTQVITVVDNTPPGLTVPPDSSVFANSVCQAVIPNVVTGSSATDNCGPVTITQSPAAGTSVGLGAHTITVTATDGAGNDTDNTVTFTVIDNTLPTITLSGNVITLWPPDHKYDTVQVSDLVVAASDNCDASVNLSSVYISKVTSDEIENGNGDGNTFNDIVIAADCRSVQLRAERGGSGNGRVYTITFKVADASGNVATVTAKVTVPKSQNGSAAVDDGPHYTVLSGCP
ncbi:MAG: HYR domain-containing protein [Pyrinomonadaceae bacterium]